MESPVYLEAPRERGWTAELGDCYENIKEKKFNFSQKLNF
jgi:hypothetical protein